MADRPILFSAPMVRALLEGRKTQTRRLLKLGNQFPDFRGGKGDWNDAASWGWEDSYGQHIGLVADGPCSQHWGQYRGAFQVDDRLWVRESWQLHSRASDLCTVAYRASVNHSGWTEAHEKFPDKLAGEMKPRPFQDGWRPSIHMPRWASRLTLTITDVRIERLQEISDLDAEAEGIYFDKIGFTAGRMGGIGGCNQEWSASPEIAFRNLWRLINGIDAWEKNPWIVALTFEVEKRNIDN